MPPLIEPVVLQPLIMANDLGVDGLHRTGLERRSFARIQDAIDVPTLIETQINSFDWFRKEGLRELFDEISPITDFTGKNMELRFLVVSYVLNASDAARVALAEFVAARARPRNQPLYRSPEQPLLRRQP